ncbi:calcium/sodium antiporter [bacterium]|nr:calcium/sodium antiporter [bacterium]
MHLLLYTVGGFFLLLAGAEILVRGSSALALRLGMRPLLIGMTIVAFGTSMPELLVSVQAALSDQSGLSVGNVVGSNICNLGLILGLSAMMRPLSVQSQTIRLDVPVMIGSSALLIFFLKSDGLSRPEGGILLLLMGGFLICSVLTSQRDRITIQSSDLGIGDIRHMKTVKMILYILSGIAALIGGAHWLILGAINLARLWGVSETVIGLTVVAVGTSLPELATSAVAALKKESDIAVGNVIGSNIFNILAILGITAAFKPLPDPGISWPSIGSMMLLSLLCLPFMKSGYRLSRSEGAVLLAFYAAYILILIQRAM